MNYSSLKRIALISFICFLGLTALIAIVSVLFGDFGDTQVKILATTSTISAASICAMSCVAYIEKKRQLFFGLAGISASLIAATMTIFMVWTDFTSHSDVFFKTLLVFVVLAIAAAHGFLLAMPELDDRQRWFQTATSACILLLALLIIMAIVGEVNEDAYYRFLATVAILVGLETLVLPILVKFRKGNATPLDTLTLVAIKDDLYRNSDGKTYRVTAVEDALEDVG